MNRRSIFTLAVTAVLGLAVAVPAGDASAQEKQHISYKVPAANTKYTQQLFVDVGDAPGHQVRAAEIHRTFPTNAPVFNGVKLVETWSRLTTDLTDGNGTGVSYNVYVLESGDKLFGRTALVTQNSGSGKISTTSVGPITGGTGKFTGIRGVVRGLTSADPKAGFNETQTDIEYWMEK